MPPAPTKTQRPRKPRTRVDVISSGQAVVGGIPDVDYLDDLAYPDYLAEFRKVANDPQVAKELRSATLPILGAEWKLEPASDDALDISVAEFVDANLYCNPCEAYGQEFFCRPAWTDRLRDILRFLSTGFSPFHVVLRVQERFWIYDTVKYLLPESFTRWYFSERDELLYAQRTYVDQAGKTHTLERIEGSELMIYTWDKEGASIFGRPMIRPMWGPYRMKTLLEKIEVIDKKKTGMGIPFFQHAGTSTPEDENRAELLLKNMRTGNLERIYAAIKEGQDFGWKEGGTQTKGLREIIEAKEEQIAKVGGHTLGEMGLAESGSRGTAGAKAAFEATLAQGIVQAICQQEQALIDDLVRMNFPGVKACPQLGCSSIDPFERIRNVPEFVRAIQAGAITADTDTENEIRRRYGFMEIDPEIADAKREERADAERRAREEYVEDDGTAAPEALARRRAVRNKRTATLEDKRDHFVRARVHAEKIRGMLRRYEDEYARSILAVTGDMRRAILDAIAAGREPKKPADVRVPFGGDLKDRLLAVLRNVRDFGREQLEAELQKQIKGIALSRAAEPMTLAPRPTTRAGAISFSNEQAEVLAQLDVTTLINRMQAQTVRDFARFTAQGLRGEALVSELQRSLADVSERSIRDMARASTADLFNQGRNVAIQEFKPQLEDTVVRTEILDDNTCDPCQGLDGKIVPIDSPAFQLYQPPAFCDGRQRCRGFYVAFAKVSP